MRLKIIIFSVLCVSTLVAQPRPWSLQECVDTALAHNRSVKQQDITRRSRQIAFDQARKDLLPDLNASTGQNWNFGRSLAVDNTYKSSNSSTTSFGISSGLTLFDGLKMKYNIDIAKADMAASEADLEKMKQDITMNVTMGYMQILLNKELLQIASDQLGLTRTRIEQRKALVTAGKLAEGELLDLTAQEAKEEMSRLQAENTLQLSLLDLAQLMDIDDYKMLDIASPEQFSEPVLLSANTVLESALLNRPEIKGAQYRLQSSEWGVKAAKSNYYPSLSLGANYGTGYYKMSNLPNNSFGQQLNDNMSGSVGLSLRIPIFNKFQVRNNVRSAELGVESSRINMETAKIELKKTIEQAYYNALGAKSRWEAAQKSEVASREAYRYASQKYEAGKSSIYELYQAKNNLTQALSEESQAKYQYLFRTKMLELLK